MNNEQKMIKMYNFVHGQIDGRTGCYLEEDPEDENKLNLMKNGTVQWSTTKDELAFDFCCYLMEEKFKQEKSDDGQYPNW